MHVISCARCGKENQPHYKFCLGCGAKLEAAAPPAEPARPASGGPTASVPLGMAKTAVPPAPAQGGRAVIGAIDLSAPAARREVTPAPVVSGVIATPAPVRT